ncbi:hypothetical protein M153_880009381 [Pseudoloma neurophilia]|uniref:GATA-type domain-containing protein n=1 Tax=Pseudoloma neurophilia TaxID=146866 RepID=A0A0R0M7A1_9MICR|nr:hypothetical protein M153_880009381 [Pseudoloma neurophilia]
MTRPQKQSPPMRSPPPVENTFYSETSGMSRSYRNPSDMTAKRSCYSCKTRCTPYWRDGWSPGITLCNACGLRFAKYRKVCSTCKAIGVKGNYDNITCPNCRKCL